MPADRRITVNIFAKGHRNEGGDFIPGPVTPVGVWARRRDVGQERKIDRAGTRDETYRDWRIRWDARIALIPTHQLTIEDGGYTFLVTNMVEVTAQRGEPDLRRKFLDLQGIRRFPQ